MSGTEISVVPKEESVSFTITRFEIGSVSVILYTTATIVVSLYSVDKFIKSEVITMTEEEYAGWGADDDYLVAFVCSKLGLVKA